MRVLLVDDEQAIVSLVATVLERRGFVTVAAATVRAAADDYVTKPFSVHEIAARIAVVGGPTGPARRRLMGGVGPVWGGAARRRPGTGRGRRELAGLSARTPATCHNNCTILVIEELATPLPAPAKWSCRWRLGVVPLHRLHRLSTPSTDPGLRGGGDDGTRTHDPLLAKQVL